NVSDSIKRGARVLVTGRLEQRTWETQDGDKRSKIEINADEIGPSLRWASAVVTKNERKSDAGGGRPVSDQGPPPRNEPEPAYAAYDEEPF
ncbi:MAG TPA: single-stranded DNA-binding protein, partial [Acidimicrobiales bacterium]|nr:single-stranded DNA-binding protein [Acidimicrobiales bacterium]